MRLWRRFCSGDALLGTRGLRPKSLRGQTGVLLHLPMRLVGQNLLLAPINVMLMLRSLHTNPSQG